MNLVLKHHLMVRPPLVCDQEVDSDTEWDPAAHDKMVLTPLLLGFESGPLRKVHLSRHKWPRG